MDDSISSATEIWPELIQNDIAKIKLALKFQKSLSTGLFPTEFKEAVVRPLLKKSRLDSTLKKNYRGTAPFQIFLSCPNYLREQPRLG